MTSRRKWLGAGIGAAGLAVAGKVASGTGLIPPDYGGVYGPGETLTYAAHRLLTRGAKAREYPRSSISAAPFANRSQFRTDDYARLARDWRIRVDGLVARPGLFSLAELREQPVRSQITQLVCEEGWSFIAEWTGVELAHVLRLVGMRDGAKFVVYESKEEGWWDSVDMEDAMHPQTLITYAMNGADLPLAHGGPLRMRVPRQLGYKSVKYLAKITVTDDIGKFGKGLGSPGPEYGYSWYAGI